jgi:hypothetical protein
LVVVILAQVVDLAVEAALQVESVATTLVAALFEETVLVAG